MERKFYWCICFENYQGCDYVEYFDTRENAVAAFEEICEICKDHVEFERDEDSCSWFDSVYNESSTVIYLSEQTMPTINHTPSSLYFDEDYEREF